MEDNIKVKRYEHEWITIMDIEICHWCGVQRKLYEGEECHGTVKVTTKGGIMKVTRRDNV